MLQLDERRRLVVLDAMHSLPERNTRLRHFDTEGRAGQRGGTHWRLINTFASGGEKIWRAEGTVGGDSVLRKEKLTRFQRRVSDNLRLREGVDPVVLCAAPRELEGGGGYCSPAAGTSA